MKALVNTPYTNRIQLLCSILGPFKNGTRAFDPRKDLSVFVNGKLTKLDSFYFDNSQNRYFLYTSDPFDVYGIVQVVHHMPADVFITDPTATGTSSPAGTLAGFALVAEKNNATD
jgi:hypothetical protein